ncbi:MAG: TonB-dependent receptor [Parvularculaceae bacterium]
MRTNKRTFALRAVLAASVSAAAMASVAFAQDGVCDPNVANDPDCPRRSSDEIIVTGSRIARPNLESPTPLTSVTVDELTSTGDLSLGDALNDLPSLRSTFSQGNSTRFIGTAGLNLLDLRSLGTSRTLVLVNGRRHITSSPGDYLVDVNTIPVDLLERVDVVTGGNSAVYGSDAVAGVVNFVMKDDFEGLTLKAQGGISSRSDRENYFVAGVWGSNFGDDRGNIAIAAEYAKTEPLYFHERESLTGALGGRCQLQQTDNPAGEVNGTDGIPDTTFQCGVRNSAISDGGTIGAIDAAGPTRRYLRFDTGGILVIDSPTLSFSAPANSGNQIGGMGSTLRNTGQLAAGVERMAFNLFTHYDISDAFVPFLEAKYVMVDAIQEGQPSFWQGALPNTGGPSGTGLPAPAALRCNNGFLTAQALAMLQSFGVCLVPATGTFSMSRFNVDFGGRGELHDRNTFRAVGGIKGSFNDDWSYEISGNYGRLDTKLRSLNNLVVRDLAGNLDGFSLATAAVLAPVGFAGTNFELNSSGQRVICAVNVVTNVRPDCVPINVFGFGSPSQAALDFVNTEANREEEAEEIDFLATMSGDLSQLFELPGGPIAFALGAEYRKEKAYSAFDPLTASGGTFLNAIQPFSPPDVSVKEAFGELLIPLLAGTPFFEELTFSGAGRMSDYDTTTGTVWAYNANVIWSPIKDIRFRGAYATSVRAPTQSDLFSPQSQNFAFIADPCDVANITSNPNRAANCAAAGVPTTYNAATTAACAATAFAAPVGSPWVNCTARSSSTGFVSGGNPTLTQERGKSLTLGVVVEPRWIPGLSVTVDYYKIKVDNLIAVLGAQVIINECYNSPTGIGNPFCGTVNRDPATGLFIQPAVVSGGVNFAAQRTSGIDIDTSYRHTFDNDQALTFRAIATWVRRLDNYVDPTNPIIPNRQLQELGDPRFAANFSVNYDFGMIDVSWDVRYMGKQTIGTWEAQNQYTGLCPVSGSTGISGRTCTPGQLALLDPQNYDLNEYVYYPHALYHDIRIDFDIGDGKYNPYFGVDNVFDKKPPLGLLGTAGGDPYDTFGMYFYAGVRANF